MGDRTDGGTDGVGWWWCSSDYVPEEEEKKGKHQRQTAWWCGDVFLLNTAEVSVTKYCGSVESCRHSF